MSLLLKKQSTHFQTSKLQQSPTSQSVVFAEEDISATLSSWKMWIAFYLKHVFLSYLIQWKYSIAFYPNFGSKMSLSPSLKMSSSLQFNILVMPH